MLAIVRWPVAEPDDLAHGHPELPEDHPHLTGHDRDEHRHPYVIDDLTACGPAKADPPRCDFTARIRVA